MHARVSDHVGSQPALALSRRLMLPSAHQEKRRHPRKRHFRGSMAGLHAPLSTLHGRPHGRPRMTRGRCGSLLLHCDGLAPSTPCRSPGAPCADPDAPDCFMQRPQEEHGAGGCPQSTVVAPVAAHACGCRPPDAPVRSRRGAVCLPARRNDVRAARAEDAAWGWIGRTRRITGQDDFACAAVSDRGSASPRADALCIGVARPLEHPCRRPLFHDPAEIEHYHPVA